VRLTAEPSGPTGSPSASTRHPLVREIDFHAPPAASADMVQGRMLPAGTRKVALNKLRTLLADLRCRSTGSCHCGAVGRRIPADDDPSKAMLFDNCSICRRKGWGLHFVDATQVRLTADPQSPGRSNRFRKRGSAHHFCKSCGIAPWSGKAWPPEGSSVPALVLMSIQPAPRKAGRTWASDTAAPLPLPCTHQTRSPCACARSQGRAQMIRRRQHRDDQGCIRSAPAGPASATALAKFLRRRKPRRSPKAAPSARIPPALPPSVGTASPAP
jgi:hypothetical protein